ncbi:MAG: chromate transporter [Treponema sp.]|nr:chromate transporter [Treponema sp.]
MEDVSLLWLFCTFFYIGLFTVGGGLVAITMMQQTIVDKGLITPEQFYNMIAISESTPGPIGVNMATFMGYKFYGIPGAIVTSIGQVLPSLLCILIIAKFILKFRDNACVKTIFNFLRPAATGMIFVIMVRICLNVLINIPEDIKSLSSLDNWKDFFVWPSLSFYILLLWLRTQFKIHPIIMIFSGALFGIVFC